MAETAGTDYSQYANWKTITAPTGATYYIVPGTGYVYDPFLSSVRGRPVLFTNPTPQVEEMDRKKAKEEKAIKAAEKASSPMGQLLPVAGTVGGLYAAKKAMNWLDAPASAATNAATNTAANADPSMLSQAGDWVSRQADAVGNWFSGGSSATPAASAAAPTSATQAFMQGATTSTIPAGASVPAGYTAVGSAANGGTMIAPTSSAATPALGITPYLGLAGAGLGAYGVFNANQAGSASQGALSGAGMGAGLGMAAPLLGLGPLGWGGLGLMALGGAGLGGGLGAIGKIGDKDMWKTEGNKLRKLSEQGVYVPDQFLNNNLKQGRSKEELIAEAKATGGNVQFAEDRKESSLRPQDIIGYASFAQKDPQWFRKPLQQQLAIAQQALDAGAVREHHGTIDVDWGKMPEVNVGPPPTNQGAPQAAPMGMAAGAPAVNKMGMVAPQTGGPRLMPSNPQMAAAAGAPQTGGPLQAAPQANPNQWYIDKAAQGIKDTGQPGQQWYIDKAAQSIKDTGAPGQQWYIDKAAQGIRDDGTKATGKVLAKRMDAKSKKK